ncbi:MAG: peptidoglycan binding domain-containing protein, partial [Chloroflexota bacterium]|nr:peptidoglycan binding domain-containing protein [Chloroflexota bacterium]
MQRYAQATREGTVSARIRLDPRRRVARRFGRLGAVLGLTLAVAAASLTGLGYLRAAGAVSEAAPPRPTPAVALDAGLEHATPQARAWLRQSFPSLSSGRAVLVLGRERRVIPYRALGRDYDVLAMLGEVLVGRGRWQQDLSLPLAGLFRRHALEKRVRFDGAAVRKAAAAAAASLLIPARDASIRLSNDASRLVVKPAAAGREVDTNDLIGALLRAIDSTDPRDVTIRLRARPVPPRVSSAQVRAVVARGERVAQRMAGDGLRLVGTPTPLVVTPATVRSWIRFVRQKDGSYLPLTSRTQVQSWLAGLARRLDVA